MAHPFAASPAPLSLPPVSVSTPMPAVWTSEIGATVVPAADAGSFTPVDVRTMSASVPSSGEIPFSFE